MILVMAAKIVYEVERVVRCTCSTVARTPLGDSQIVNDIELLESRYLPQPDWTDDDLRIGVATFLSVDPSEVQIANSGAN